MNAEQSDEIPGGVVCARVEYVAETDAGGGVNDDGEGAFVEAGHSVRSTSSGLSLYFSIRTGKST